jgi:Cu+-exporting ATPase
MKSLSKLLLVLGACAVVPTACRAPMTAEIQVQTLTFAIAGMTCAVNCPPRVQAAFESVEGVESATVDYDTRSATVTCRAGTDPEKLLAAVRKQGFGATLR